MREEIIIEALRAMYGKPCCQNCENFKYDNQSGFRLCVKDKDGNGYMPNAKEHIEEVLKGDSHQRLKILLRGAKNERKD